MWIKITNGIPKWISQGKAEEGLMDKTKAMAEIERICKEAGLHCLVVPDKKTMDEMLEDMRRGAYVKAGLRAYGIPVEKEYLV